MPQFPSVQAAQIDRHLLRLHVERCAYLARLFPSLGPRGRAIIVRMWAEHAVLVERIVTRLRPA